MTTIQLDAGTLTASEDDRTLSGLLVPYGEDAKSNLGKFSVSEGVFEIPSDLSGMSLNEEHARESVLGGFLRAEETPAGITATFSVARTPAGDQALADVATGKRKHLSAEVSGVVIRAGKAVAGRLFAAALVAKPAFPSATLLAAAEDTTTAEYTSSSKDPDGSEYDSKTVETVEETEEDGVKTVTRTSVTTTTIKPATPEEEAPVAENLPADLLAAKAGSTTSATQKGLSLREVGDLLFASKNGTISDEDLASALKGHNGETLFGALSDVKFDGAGGLAPIMGQPAWIGEVWNASQYRQQVLPLFSHENLTSLTFSGFKWVTKPSGGDWAGNKANVPSNTISVAPVTGSASRYAVGHDIAHEFVDFPVPGFFESYAKYVGEDYQRWADAKVLAAILAGATAMAGDPLSTLPGGTNNIGAAASAIIDGAVAVAQTGTLPSFALVAPALYKSFVKNPSTNVLGYLNAALGLTEGALGGFTIRPSASVPAGKVLVGATQAVTVYELPGVPVRLDALDLARGGVDKAALGYLATNVNDATALQLVTAATAA
ncbi:hypothetical protein C5C41_06735 [Rathayibacter sp. AY1E9]|uniref:hypothetical protein n=1 Tax=Rathayibacter sp. AY1E9 TaxID=2080556 RepID=UPI000CE80F84|nr:hypothetical protein [Rathayibacter sp. AY1E9]PPG53415.1 hypothetical protein C5C41_06735 [Rathayibacter sp. AY1E9]